MNIDIYDKKPNLEFRTKMLLFREADRIYCNVSGHYNTRINLENDMFINIICPIDVSFLLMNKLYGIQCTYLFDQCICEYKDVVILISLNMENYISVYLFNDQYFYKSYIVSKEEVSIIALKFDNYKDLYIEYK